jgi:acetyl-CoA C-acetyltransferase
VVDARQSAVLVGAGQLTQREAEAKRAMSPPELMAEAARRAALDSGAGPTLLEKIDYLGVVDTLGWRASNPARLVAQAVGAHPAREVVSTIGGDTPQALVNHVAAEIAAGRVGLAVLAGCNAMHSALRIEAGIRLDWPSGGEGKPLSFGDARPGSNDYENRHGLVLPLAIYPLFENAFRAFRGWNLETHRRKLGELLSGFNSGTPANPYAWFRWPDGEEISTPSPRTAWSPSPTRST